MSKTTPEEAARLAKKHGATRHEGGGYTNLTLTSSQLATLIDEVRGVDTEPVAKHVGIVSGILGDICTIQLNGYAVRKGDKLYTRPAPSQPATAVELPVVMNKITPPPAYACIRRANGEDKCSRWCGDSAKCIASPMLEEAKAAIKLRYTGQGAASEPESTNPYRAGSNAALYWQAGHDAAQAAIAAGREP